jgi:archaellum biogenesis protein FlaJ (TadC family)
MSSVLPAMPNFGPAMYKPIYFSLIVSGATLTIIITVIGMLTAKGILLFFVMHNFPCEQE